MEKDEYGRPEVDYKYRKTVKNTDELYHGSLRKLYTIIELDTNPDHEIKILDNLIENDEARDCASTSSAGDYYNGEKTGENSLEPGKNRTISIIDTAVSNGVLPCLKENGDASYCSTFVNTPSKETRICPEENLEQLKNVAENQSKLPENADISNESQQSLSLENPEPLEMLPSSEVANIAGINERKQKLYGEHMTTNTTQYEINTNFPGNIEHHAEFSLNICNKINGIHKEKPTYQGKTYGNTSTTSITSTEDINDYTGIDLGINGLNQTVKPANQAEGGVQEENHFEHQLANLLKHIVIYMNRTGKYKQAIHLESISTFINVVCEPKQTFKHMTPADKDKYEFHEYKFRTLPTYWREANNFLDKHVWRPPQFVIVDYKTKQEITHLVNSTWKWGYVGRGNDARGLSHSSLQVVSVQRVENKDLFYAYDFERKRKRAVCYPCTPVGQTNLSTGDVLTSRYVTPSMREQLYEDINEHYLFHGTDASLVDAIASNGLDPKITHSKSMLGKAIYCSESSTKADQYADRRKRQNNGIQTMFLVRAILGEVFVVNEFHRCVVNKDARRLLRPPCYNCLNDFCSCPGQNLYGSVMADGRWIFREFALYDKNLCYPEYLIHYRRV